MKLLFPFWRYFSLRTQVFVGLALPLVTVFVVSWVVERSLESARAVSGEAELSIRAVVVRGELLKAVLDAETGERGFIITGNPAFLEPYREARSRFAQAAREWRALDKGAETPYLDRIDSLFGRWMEEVAAPAIAARENAPGQLLSNSFDALQQVTLLRDHLEHIDPAAIVEGSLLGYLAPLKLAVRLGSNTQDDSRWLQVAMEGERLAQLLERLPGSSGRQVVDDASHVAGQLEVKLRDLTHKAHRTENLAAQIVMSGRGRELVAEIRELVARAIAEKERVHAELAAQARSRMQWVDRLSIILPVAGVGLGLALLLLMQLDTIRSIRKLRVGVRRIEEGDLAFRVDDPRSDELGSLGVGFNRMARQLELSKHDSELLESLQSMLISSNSESEAYSATVRALEKLLPRLSGALYVLAASRDFAELAVCWGNNEASAERFHPDDCRALRMGRIHHVSNDSAELFCGHVNERALTSSVCIPLVTRDDVLGTLFLATPLGEQQEIGSYEKAVATTVGERLALALSNLRLTEKLRRESVRDPLTGLFNRRYLEETLDREMARAERAGKTISIISLDVDHFKHFNDSFGHDAGDRVLKELAAKMVSAVRSGDIACRFGGEEFILVLPDADGHIACQRAEELRRQVENLELRYAGKSLGSLTISLGVAVFPVQAGNREELMCLADDALYAAKRQGRNRVILSGTESDHG